MFTKHNVWYWNMRDALLPQCLHLVYLELFQTEWCDIIPECVCIYLVHLIILIRANIQTESCQWFHRMWMHCSLVCFLFAVPCWGSDIRLLIITLVNCPSNVQKQLHSLLSLLWRDIRLCNFEYFDNLYFVALSSWHFLSMTLGWLRLNP